MDDVFYEFIKTLKEKLYQELNGRIEYEAYPSIDTVIFKVFFKDFDFSYPVNNIQDHIYSGDGDAIISDLKQCYMSAIKKAFFKTDCKTSRSQGSKIGIKTIKRGVV